MSKSSTPKGYSLHVGLNEVNPKHYQGWVGRLTACEADAEDMAAIAKAQRYTKSVKLLTKKATRKNVVAEMTRLALVLNPGDIFFLTYSGHGGQLPDLNADEDDGQDETWCLYDGELVDDELYALYAKFKSGVRVLVLSDSCHSGTATRAMFYDRQPRNYKPAALKRFMPPEVALRTYRANKAFYDKLLSTPKQKTAVKDTLKARVRLISGCQDNQESSDGDFNGLFTANLLRVWNEGKFKGDYLKFHKAILKNMPPDQSPNHFVIGKPNPAFDKGRPFVI